MENGMMHLAERVWVLVLSLLMCAAAAQAKRPNVLVIVADDQGYCELGPYMDFADPDTMGAKRIDEWKKITECTPEQAPIDVCMEAARKCMPTMDRIAAQGLRLTDFRAAPTCAPSRAALMSACYPQRFGVYCNDDLEGQFGKGLPVSVDFPVRLFTEAGYRTGMIGKWHLGDLPGQWPHQKGFEYFFGFNRAHTEKYGSKILHRNDESVPAEGWLEDQISNEAVAFLERALDGDRPFFLKVAYNVPHGPMPRPPQQYIDYINSGSDIVDVYFATIYGMDCGIARMVDKLEKAGELDNTLIFYFSDNGQARGPYHYGFKVNKEAYLVPVPGNGPLQGCKWSPWEGGVRVPCIVRLPGGQTGSSDKLLSVMDVLPTALDYAGIELPAEMKLDGVSFLPELHGEKMEDRTIFWASDSQEPFGNFGPEHDALLDDVHRLYEQKDIEVRAARHPPSWYVRTEKWKLMGWDLIDPVLIDMENDIGEHHNLAAQYPEVVSDLKKQFAGWFAQQADPLVYPDSQFGKLNQLTGEKRVPAAPATAPAAVPVSADPLAEWTFDSTGPGPQDARLAAALGATAVAAGLSVSDLALNSSFDFAGFNQVPESDNDGAGFGASQGKSVLFIHRAINGRPSLWGSDAGTTLAGAPLSFTVRADEGKTVTLAGITVFRGGGPDLILCVQEAGAVRGKPQTLDGKESSKLIFFDAPVAIPSGGSKTITANLNSGRFDSKHSLDRIVLNGTVNSEVVR
jgi:uncharacterized sulfatase